MSRDAATESNRSQEIELSTRSTTNTQTFLETCAFDADHTALAEHLVNNQIVQSDLDRCLFRGLRMVQRKEKELSHVAPTLTLLLQSGAKWNIDILLDNQKTPYHIICESPGDHHHLLDLMIECSQQTIIDAQDWTGRTALMRAVLNANVNCLKCLIANGADIYILNDNYQYIVRGLPPQKSSALIEAIMMMHSDCNFTSANKDIFDILFDKSSFDCCMPLFTVAANFGIVYCIKKLIEKKAHPDFIDPYQRYVWPKIASTGNVELLKWLFNHDIDKDIIDENDVSILYYVVTSDNIEAVRYLLDLGVDIPTYTPEVRKTQCEQYKENMLIVNKEHYWYNQDPFMRSICYNQLEMIKLLDEYGSQTCKSFNALKIAVMYHRVEVVSYLLNKYTYPLNLEFIRYVKTDSNPSGTKQGYTLLTEPNLSGFTQLRSLQIIKLLLDHGADPAKTMCTARSANAIMAAINHRNLNVMAHYIRSGVDINFCSHDYVHGNVLPFESSILRGYHDVAEMLLNSGCSCGVFSLDDNHKFKNNQKPEVVNLMKEWKVQENNVKPLKQRCRCVILNHLSPRADLKIKKLPLPRCLIKFLNIPELDVIHDLGGE